MKAFESCHILLDQVYSYDQGYNALEAMAIGKVVFTGAEEEWLEYYNVDETKVVINALPNTDYIISKLEWLINNPKKIIGLEGYGLEVVEQVPIRVKPNKHNKRYLKTKREKLGHLL